MYYVILSNDVQVQVNDDLEIVKMFLPEMVTPWGVSCTQTVTSNDGMRTYDKKASPKKEKRYSKKVKPVDFNKNLHEDWEKEIKDSVSSQKNKDSKLNDIISAQEKTKSSKDEIKRIANNAINEIGEGSEYGANVFNGDEKIFKIGIFSKKTFDMSYIEIDNVCDVEDEILSFFI